MIYSLDANVIIGLLTGKRGLIDRVSRHAPDHLGISVIVMHELYYGAYKGRKTVMNLAALDRLRFPVLDLDKADAQQAAEIRSALASMGSPIGPYDLMIAGQARARGLIVVTRNVREFARVDGLAVENWEDQSPVIS